MSSENLVAGKYARALLFLAQEAGKLEQIQQDLELVADVFGAGEGRELLLHPLLSLEQKQEAVKTMVQGKVTTLTLSLLRLLIDKRRVSLVADIARAYHEELQRLQGLRTATVTAAIPLTEDQLEALHQKLSDLAGASVELTQVLDPSLRGGARIVMGDLVLDGSIGARLAQLRRALTSNRTDEN
jgi:F-type H+-transporting ATPase subunit delta